MRDFKTLAFASVAAILLLPHWTKRAEAQATTPSPATSPSPMFETAWRSIASPVAVELRGLSVPSNKVAWASGARGTILRTVEGSAWRVVPVPGGEAFDFRDIEAFDDKTAVALTIGPGQSSNVFKTKDGGVTWRKVFTNPEEGGLGFWDAIAFWDRERGVMFGDPVRGRFQVYTTRDGGETWTATPVDGLPLALEGEGGFAASGQCLAVGPEGRVAIVTGGAARSRVFVSKDYGRTFSVSETPIQAAAASKGLFAAHWTDANTLVVVGGDYRERSLAGISAARSIDGGATWASVTVNPAGFLSSVVGGSRGSIVAVGLTGTGISEDGGRTWTALGATPYNTAAFTKDGAGWAVGFKGTIGRWER